MGGAREMDVTAKLSELARDGQLFAAANNDVLGRDPAVNHVKELRVDYTLDGHPRYATVHEGETLALPATASTGLAPQWETSQSPGGLPVVKAWSNGRVELRTASGKVLAAEAANIPAPLTVTGAWSLSFPPNWGAPPSVSWKN